MAERKWCFANLTPLMDAPNGKRLFDIPLGAVLEPTPAPLQTVIAAGKETTWIELPYNEVTGWVNSIYLDDCIEQFPDNEVLIQRATPDPRDAAQYMLIGGNKKVNMCGELCIAFVVKKDADSVLGAWEEKLPDLYNKIVGGDKETFPSDLEKILSVYDYTSENGRVMNFKDGLTDPGIGFAISPGRIGKMLKTHYLIALVRIKNGRLIPSDEVDKNGKKVGVDHWVVTDKIAPNGINSGRVELYNPFPNRRQEYSYNEFVRSCQPPNWPGLWVARSAGSS